MKTLKFVPLLLSIVILIVMSCSDQSQSPVSPDENSITSLNKNIIRMFTGYEYPTSYVSPGKRFLAGGNQIVRGIQYTTRFEATFSDGKPDLLTGDGELELNTVYDVNTFEGFATGKLTVTPTNPDFDFEGGVWEITWNSKVYFDPDLGLLVYPGKWVGHGKGGIINGMQVFGDDIIKYNPFDPMAWWGDGGTNCYVKEHK